MERAGAPPAQGTACQHRGFSASHPKGDNMHKTPGLFGHCVHLHRGKSTGPLLTIITASSSPPCSQLKITSQGGICKITKPQSALAKRIYTSLLSSGLSPHHPHWVFSSHHPPYVTAALILSTSTGRCRVFFILASSLPAQNLPKSRCSITDGNQWGTGWGM